ncbi:hypothetical protein BDN70DRAFT_350316 [Pholiota conissans]|uniref:F-box domain-containing protein n=1 Tax=Pholiota conissans TaxID=109636 RepID=A0A9P5ZAV7_9AGAR|nr:hypothetical protein BDN70DRAFT_350316 [Pholiota conissans]
METLHSDCDKSFIGNKDYFYHPTGPNALAACIPCKKVAELDQKMSQMRQSIIDMEKERQQWKTQINAKHDKFMRNFPVEIIAAILELSLPDDVAHLRLESVNSKYTLSAPLVLSAVSQRWRTIAHSTPQIWTTVPIRIGKHNCHLLPLLATEWIERSSPLPLSVNISAEDDSKETQEVIKTVTRYCSRWTWLKYEGEATNFSHFSTDEEGTLQLNTVNLRTPGAEVPAAMFELGKMIVRANRLVLVSVFCIDMVNVAWNHLTELFIIELAPPECLEALRRAPRLVKCTFGSKKHITSTRYQLPNFHHPIVHRAIVNLTLFGNHCLPIFTHLRCPSLKILEVQSYRGNAPAVAQMVRFILNSKCLLLHLYLGRTLIHQNEIDWLGHLHSLRLLAINFMTPHLDDTLFALLAQTSTVDGVVKPLYLPKLQELEIQQGNMFNWTLLPLIFCTTESPERHRTRLERLAFSVPSNGELVDIPEVTMSEATKQQLLSLKAQEVKMTIAVGKVIKDLV